MFMKCSHCGNDKFHADLEKQILSCARCRYYYDFTDLIRDAWVPSTQYERRAYDPAKFEIANGILTKYKGNDHVVTVPDGVNVIYKGAFRGNSTVRTVLLPEGVQRIEEHAFHDCSQLEYVRLPNTLMEIGEQAFYRCEEMTDIVLPMGLRLIGDGAFAYCRSLEQITIPKSVRQIGQSYTAQPVFQGCDSLETISYPEKQFNIEKFRGSLYYRRHPVGQRRMIEIGICPRCDGRIGLFRRCRSCGMRW